MEAMQNACGDCMRTAELLYREASYEAAFAAMDEAIGRFDALPYDEPHGWLMSPRQTMGALLTEQQQYERAMALYDEDLLLFPKNVWALAGLKICCTKTASPRLAEIEAALDQASHRIRLAGGGGTDIDGDGGRRRILRIRLGKSVGVNDHRRSLRDDVERAAEDSRRREQRGQRLEARPWRRISGRLAEYDRRQGRRCRDERAVIDIGPASLNAEAAEEPRADETSLGGRCLPAREAVGPP